VSLIGGKQGFVAASLIFLGQLVPDDGDSVLFVAIWGA
jgi:hypothetical protein